MTIAKRSAELEARDSAHERHDRLSCRRSWPETLGHAVAFMTTAVVAAMVGNNLSTRGALLPRSDAGQQYLSIDPSFTFTLMNLPKAWTKREIGDLGKREKQWRNEYAEERFFEHHPLASTIITVIEEPQRQRLSWSEPEGAEVFFFYI